ncbi:calcium-activated chloride channel regulator 1-like [Ptychodera flava]|uniref:calcium-activated chloride channel regulator 1-like n=1 Tax=Ptychodera flava TaxID=63121 RepID=UPI00396A5E86
MCRVPVFSCTFCRFIRVGIRRRVRMVFPLVVMMVLLLHCVDGCGRHCFRTADELELENNGYIGIIIGIDDRVQENSKLIDEIKDIFTDGSAELYKATRKRAYFRQITITVPSHWSDSVTSTRATTESYDRSHIIIDQGLANTPYVTGIPGCGQMGRYMHLTPNYILDPDVQDNYGPGGKTMVHEWGHLRYGVFDEYPTDENKQHYFSTKGAVEAIRCSAAIKGGVHNVEAPSRHNRLCQQRSVWEVMRNNDDFRNNANPPRTISSTKPRFRVVKRTVSNVAMVLSVGASMASANRMEKMGQAVRSFIMNDVQDGQRVGMVTFSDKGNMTSDMVAMNDSMRDTMLKDIPTRDDVGGSSNLEAGVMKGIEVLEKDGRNPSGGVILLVTDGQENENDKMDEMMPMLKEKNVTVDFIAIGGNASKNLETIAESTNGMSFSYSEEYSSSNGLNEAFDTISQRGQSIYTDLPVTVYSKALHVESQGSEEFTFNIDSTIGNGTQLTFDCLGGNGTAEVTVRKPDGGEIKEDSEGYQIDSRFM